MLIPERCVETSAEQGVPVDVRVVFADVEFDPPPVLPIAHPSLDVDTGMALALAGYRGALMVADLRLEQVFQREHADVVEVLLHSALASDLPRLAVGRFGAIEVGDGLHLDPPLRQHPAHLGE